MENNEQCFSDMYLIAALLSYAPHSLIKIDKENPKRQRFYFSDTVLEVFIQTHEGPTKKFKPSLAEIQTWYTAGILMFKPNYPECIKKIKSEVHS